MSFRNFRSDLDIVLFALVTFFCKDMSLGKNLQICSRHNIHQGCHEQVDKLFQGHELSACTKKCTATYYVVHTMYIVCSYFFIHTYITLSKLAGRELYVQDT